MPMDDPWQESTYVTHAIQYTLRTTETPSIVPTNPRQCTLGVAIVGSSGGHGGGGLRVRIPCFHGTDCFADLDDYFNICKRRIAQVVSRQYESFIPPCCAEAVALGAMSLIYFTRADHRRRCEQGASTAIPTVHICVDLLDEEIERDIELESFEEARPKVKPATRQSVEDLIVERLQLEAAEGDAFEASWGDSDHECVICLEDIEKRSSSLKMPCSHVFHEDCLVKWLVMSHFCPLCRYEMPIEL